MRRGPITDAPCYDLSVKIGEASVAHRQKVLGTRKASRPRGACRQGDLPGPETLKPFTTTCANAMFGLADGDLRLQALSISDMK